MLINTWITYLQLIRCVIKINFSTLQTKMEKKLYTYVEIMKVSIPFQKEI